MRPSSASVALAAPLAYVPNEKSGTISVIDTATGEAEFRGWGSIQRVSLGINKR